MRVVGVLRATRSPRSNLLRFSLYSVTGVCSFCLVFPMRVAVSGLSPARGSCLAAPGAGLRVPGGAVADDALGLGEEGFAAGGEEGVLDRGQHGAVGQAETEAAGQVEDAG